MDLILTVSVSMAVALILGYLTQRLGLSPLVGYLLAGIIVGPNTPGFIANHEIAEQLAEIGIVLLMFGVGLHFDLADLFAVKRIAVPGAIAKTLAATVLGMIVALFFGLSLGTGVVFGLALAVASTVVLIRCLSDNDMLDTPHGHVAVGWLIVEDIFTVLVLVLLPVIPMAFSAGSGQETVNVLSALGMAVAKLTALWILILPVGGRIIPWLLSHVARSRSRELFTLAILALAFLIAAGSAMVFDVSVALGAFLAGMVVGRTGMSHQAAADILSMRDAFAVLFFLSIGMLLDPYFIWNNSGFILACLGVILVGKSMVAVLVIVLPGYSIRTALVTAIGLAQIGEFSFLLAQQARSLDLMPQEGFSVIVSCAMISIALNPLLFKTIDPLEKRLLGIKGLRNYLDRRSDAERLQAQSNLARMEKPPAIVIGYGPVGKKVASILRESDFEVVIVDLNVDTVNNLVAEGQAAIYGDAGRREILKAARIEAAKYLLITIPDFTKTIGIVTSTHSLNPEIKIFVRARFLYAKSILEELGVTAVFFEEEEIAKAMTKALAAEVLKENV